jgi:hypothetical protein
VICGVSAMSLAGDASGISAPRPVRVEAPQAAEPLPDCSKDDSEGGLGIIGRNPDKECRLPTGVTVSDETGRGYTMAVRVLSKRPESTVGLAFAVKTSEPRSHYVFSIRHDGTYQLFRRVGEAVTVLIDWTRSPAVKTDPSLEQQLTVLTTDGMVRCFVNGQYVGGAAAAPSLSGGLSYYTGGVIHAKFGHFLIEDHPRPPAGTPTPGRIVVSDDMVTRRNFQVGGGGVCRASYDEEGYLVENVASIGLCDLPLVSLGTIGRQIRIEADVKLRRGPFNQSFGVFFGRPLRDPGLMYAALIDGQGTFQIVRRQGGWQRLTPLLVHDPIRKGSGVWNRVAIEVRDQTIRGYVNGEPVGQAEATAIVEGGIGFYLNTPGMAAVFRNLTITEL